ncbi:MAG: hypothetical protein Q9194_000727 [Teloschistes cf. exilis]
MNSRPKRKPLSEMQDDPVKKPKTEEKEMAEKQDGPVKKPGKTWSDGSIIIPNRVTEGLLYFRFEAWPLDIANTVQETIDECKDDDFLRTIATRRTFN